jgi:Cytochrome C'
MKLISGTVIGVVLAATGAVTFSQVVPRQAAQAGPKLIPVAETKLLMEGLNQPNFQSLEKLLKDKPADAETWTFARGQALLIAETGNLLMLRPPRNPGERTWLNRATDLRSKAAQLARSLADKDLEKSRKGLTAVATSCNACHQSFRVKVRIAAFEEKGAKEDKDKE